ncbi:hypothetical protein CMV_023739 [Castanea mollissima]|uniref:Uncharacterized protein n=1 Tax=Castanea mollissima TaxID=60419 RepID=A0A8J4QGY3_9ROSI|nr:hypothetical protein CMV_023739 [Castanea mollissima]
MRCACLRWTGCELAGERRDFCRRSNGLVSSGESARVPAMKWVWECDVAGDEMGLGSKCTILLKKIFKFNVQVSTSIFKLNIRWCKSWVTISSSGGSYIYLQRKGY